MNKFILAFLLVGYLLKKGFAELTIFKFLEDEKLQECLNEEMKKYLKSFQKAKEADEKAKKSFFRKRAEKAHVKAKEAQNKAKKEVSNQVSATCHGRNDSSQIEVAMNTVFGGGVSTPVQFDVIKYEYTENGKLFSKNFDKSNKLKLIYKPGKNTADAQFEMLTSKLIKELNQLLTLKTIFEENELSLDYKMFYMQHAKNSKNILFVDKNILLVEFIEGAQDFHIDRRETDHLKRMEKLKSLYEMMKLADEEKIINTIVHASVVDFLLGIVDNKPANFMFHRDHGYFRIDFGFALAVNNKGPYTDTHVLRIPDQMWNYLMENKLAHKVVRKLNRKFNSLLKKKEEFFEEMQKVLNKTCKNESFNCESALKNHLVNVEKNLAAKNRLKLLSTLHIETMSAKLKHDYADGKTLKIGVGAAFLGTTVSPMSLPESDPIRVGEFFDRFETFDKCMTYDDPKASETLEFKFICAESGTSTKPTSEVETKNLQESTQENKEITKEQKAEDIFLTEEVEYNAQQSTEAKSSILKNVVNVDQSHIKRVLEKSEKDDAKQYRGETPETQEKIQQFIAKALDNEAGFKITENDVIGALAEYYNVRVLYEEESNAVSFGALDAAVMCMLLLN